MSKQENSGSSLNRKTTQQGILCLEFHGEFIRGIRRCRVDGDLFNQPPDELLKVKLHKGFEYDRDGYTDAKSAFVRAVTEKARKL